MMVTLIATMLVMVNAIPYITANGGFTSAAAWRHVVLYVALLSMSITAFAIIGIWKKDNKDNYSSSQNSDKRQLKEYLELLKNNKPLQMLLVAASTNKIASQFQSATLIFFFMIVIGDVGLQPKFSALTMPLAIFGTFAAIIIAIKKGNKSSFVFGSWSAVIVGIIILLIRPFSPEQFSMFFVLLAAFTLLNTLTATNINPMIADITDYENYKNGRFIPGMISTAFSFVDKFTSSFATAIVGSIIAYFGYVEGGEVTNTLYWSMVFMYLGVPLLGHIASVIAMKYYKIDKEYCVKINNEINNRKSS